MRRTWGLVLALLFVVMCALIAWGQWYAVHVNVPRYKAHATTR
jgi:TRAP-type C4-dicarboxylate transport system permease small subunit